MKILIDIGAYNGDTLELALKHNYDAIHCFEPVISHMAALFRKAQYHSNVKIYPYGLLDKACTKNIYAPGSDGASIYKEKKQFSHQGKVEECQFHKASEFFINIPAGIEIHVKINCEGAELDILTDLNNKNQLNKINDLCVHYDVLKIPGLGAGTVNDLELMLNREFTGKRLTVGKNKQIHNDYNVDLSREKFWVRNWLNHINHP